MYILLGILIFKGLTARHLCKSFSVKGLIVKTVEYGVLKPHVHCVKIPYIHQRWVFDIAVYRNRIVVPQLFEEEITAEN
jgi:hypothetical protein